MNPSQFYVGLIVVLVAAIVGAFGGSIGALVLAAIGLVLMSRSWRNPGHH